MKVNGAVMKRLFDLLIASFALLLLALPLLCLVCIVRTKLGSPVFFVQVGPGIIGELCSMVKFRTMANARCVDGSMRPDPDRLTPFGQFLRASSLDKLPAWKNYLNFGAYLKAERAWSDCVHY